MHAVLFDLDDTLIDRQAAFRRYAEDLVRRKGLAPSALDTLIFCDQRGYGPRLRFARDVLEQIPALAWTVEELLDDFKTVFPTFVEPDPTVQQRLQELRDELPVAIVTNGSGQRQRAKMKAAGLDVGAGLFISQELGSAKPDPAIFQAALDELGCTAQGTWFVGDHPQHDIVGAGNLGMRTCWIQHDRKWPADIALEPDVVVNRVHEAFENIA